VFLKYSDQPRFKNRIIILESSPFQDTFVILAISHDWHWLKKPVPINGFLGIRYLERLPEIKKLLIMARLLDTS